ncbi:zinc finger protein 665 [Ceratitis capitata]|uniref:zinc finger protein 665 n=1 Tax=Ceratitis capitata TaxID=7213 RepID=UPI000329D7A0|nr:zinc finger protein 665 [Ceratitis capitata]XP_020716133.1 zinc finger protein 665 [Ceratitis capitata]
MSVYESLINEEKVCRLCGEEQRNVMELFGEGNNDIVNLVTRILGCLKIEFIKNNCYPKWICVACHLEAESTNSFLLTVEEGQRKLFELIKNKKTIETINTQELQNSIDNEQITKCKSTEQTNNIFVGEAAIKSQSAVSTNKYPKRVRKKKKRFPCDPLPYTDDIEKLQNNSEDVNTGTFITIKPIAELRSANGASLAEIISVDSDAPQQSTSSKPEIRLICEYCKDVFTKQNSFLKHLRTHNESLYECTTCIAKFERPKDLKAHQRQNGHKGMSILAKTKTENNDEIPEKQSGDEMSETTINIVVDDEGHITSIDSDLKNTPRASEKNSGSPSPLGAKMDQTVPDSSHKSNSFKCLKCNKVFTNNYSVVRHHKHVHMDTRSYKCKYCLASFKHANNLAYHIAKHTGIRNFKCNLCTKSFIYKNELTVHMRTHTGDKPHICPHCEKAFAHRSNMVTHMRLHSGQRPFKCETCGATFNSSSHWKLHKQMHVKHAQRAVLSRLHDKTVKDDNSKEKSQLSNACITEQTSRPEENSKESSSLLRPKTTVVKSVEILPPLITPPNPNTTISSNELKSLIHTNIQTINSRSSAVSQLKFQCDQCLQRFKLKSALTKHLRTHTGEKPYKCPLCPRTFADASNFKRHKVLHKTATEQLENVTRQYKSSDLLHEFQRDKSKSFPMVNVSPTHSVASDPDPDGLEAFQLATVASSKELSDTSDEDDTLFHMLNHIAGETNQQALCGNDSSVAENSLNDSHRTVTPKTPPKLVCISYPNPANPSDSKMTTFYV